MFLSDLHEIFVVLRAEHDQFGAQPTQNGELEYGSHVFGSLL